jgi:DNA-binding NarL/FixJ family response regulator
MQEITKLKNKGLSQTEIRIAFDASRGFSNEEIADKLSRTEVEIKCIMRQVYHKLEIKGRAALIVMLYFSE